MARARKTDQEQSAGKNTKKTAPERETPEQTPAHTPEPETPEQTQAPTPEPETPEQTQAPTPEQETSEQDQGTQPEPSEVLPAGRGGARERAETSPQAGAEHSGLCDDEEPDMFAKLPNPCVYCGPSVKGVARQYTTYQGGIPDVLREFIKARPEALELIVSTGQFQAMRRRLETPGTKETKLYKAVKART